MTWQEVLAHAGCAVPSRDRVDRVGFTPAERRALGAHWPRDPQEGAPNGYNPAASQVLRP